MKLYLEDDNYFLTKKTTRNIRSACKFFADNNDMPDVRLIVTVGDFRSKTLYASCEQITKKLYVITLSRPITKKIATWKFEGFQILFHELEHVRQFSNGELYYTRKLQRQKFLGESMEKIPYRKQPFEIQADEIGTEFARDFLTVVVRDILTELQRGD